VKTVVLTPSTHDLPPGWSGEDLRKTVQAAAARWSYPQVPCALKVTVAEPTSAWRATQDGTNLIVYRSQTWCHNERCGPESTFPLRVTGMTTSYPTGAAGRAVVEGDVELNGVTFAPTATAGKWTAPLESVLVHELGHVVGLPDACLVDHRASGRPVIGGCGPEESTRAMFPTGLHDALAAGDVAALCALYPPEGGSSQRSFMPTAAIATAVVAALALALVMVRRRRRARR
jgi:hypothetical protein